MKKNEVTEIDIAAALKINPITVKRFLAGRPVQRSTKANIQRFVQEYTAALALRKAVTA